MLLCLSTSAASDMVEADASPVPERITPYYMTEEYAEMKRQEQIEAEAEANALRASIEAYEEEQQRKAEEEFRAMQESYSEYYEEPQIEVEQPEELSYPFNTMSQDWGSCDLEGFVFYEIPKEYADYGGYLPKVMQAFLYSICRDMGYDYPTALAQIEQETGYQWDCVGAANDTGYFQVIAKYHKERMERLDLTDAMNPYQNSLIAVDYMVELLDKYDGNLKKALTAYNCGPDGAYRNYFSAGVEVNGYAKSVLKRAERIRKELEDAAED